MFKGGPGDYNRVMIWTSGSLWGAGWAYVRALVPVILLGGAYIFYKGRMLDALSFRMKRRLAGEFPSSVNGKNVALCSYSCGSIDCICWKYRLYRTACAACSKKVVGNGHRVSLLLASLIAAVMLIFADTVAGNLFSPIEIPAGIAVSLVGVPYFVYLMWKE